MFNSTILDYELILISCITNYYYHYKNLDFIKTV